MANSKQLRIATTLIALLVGIVARQQVDAWWLFSQEQTTAAPAPVPAPVSSSQGQTELKAIAQFDLDGVQGSIKFAQRSPQEATRVEYDLRGLKGNNKLYHVHIRPVPEYNVQQVRQNATLIKQLCADPATGGHLNPHHVTQKLPPKSAPLDHYETGDLSGKHGPFLELAGQPDHYVGSYTDDKLPMSGEHSIIGRSIVIHKNDGARWVCASIKQVA